MKRTWIYVGVGVLVGMGLILIAGAKNDSSSSSPETTSVPKASNLPTATGVVGKWQWSRREANGDIIIDPTGGTYTIELKSDGSFNAQVDCNVVQGGYTAEAFETQETEGVELGQFAFSPGPTTLAECGPESFYDDVLQMMATAQDYQLTDDGQTLIFVWPAAGPLDYYVRIQ